ncbi:MAG: DUF5714 domain-containing protein [Deferribacterota bacterium]|nr:DUF5714 domain-containing protein [Deferribacterota bacterium]
MAFKTGCIICGSELVYKDNIEKVQCYFCGEETKSNVICINGHFICDKCHSLKANEFIQRICVNSKIKDPLELASQIMEHQKVNMHGPEHHFLVPAVLLATYYNAIGKTGEKETKIIEAKRRAKNVLGGFCGFYGSCGAAIGAGIFMSIITNSTPLSKEGWSLSNKITALCLNSIAEAGGPRCCKRNTFIALIEAINFINKNLNVSMNYNKMVCNFTSLNKECLKINCPFYKI